MSAVELVVNSTVGETIPPNTSHAVSVSLPTWRANVGYEEGEAWVVEKMQCGYPRFFIHKSIVKLSEDIVRLYGSSETDKALLFATRKAATRCKAFLTRPDAVNAIKGHVRIVELVPRVSTTPLESGNLAQPHMSAVLYPKELWPEAKAFWQHSGEGTSSRRAEFCQKALDNKMLVERSASIESTARLVKGPKRYQRPMSTDHGTSSGSTDYKPSGISATNGVSVTDSASFVEERFGRNLHLDFAAQAKLAIRRRIAGSLTNDADLPGSLDESPPSPPRSIRNIPGFSEKDVYLYPMGMNAIFHAHQTLLAARGAHKSVMFGFPYVDTLKVLQKFGPGAVFYGYGDSSDLDKLEKELESGTRYLSLFAEFPGNPLLKTPDLLRLRALADKYSFALVIDETIGNFLNVHVLPYADIVVSSLTKVFSGDSNVMGGSLILNPRSALYPDLKRVLDAEYEDTLFEEDSVYLERNSRDFASRSKRINRNAEVVADVLRAHPRVKQVNYPKYSPSRPFFDACRLPEGGYGGLLSATFHSVSDAAAFYDHLDTQKGPSLGTNFTLSSPFVILAHYAELDWAAQYGCEASLVRFSVGLEEMEELKRVFEFALAAIPNS